MSRKLLSVLGVSGFVLTGAVLWRIAIMQHQSPHPPPQAASVGKMSRNNETGSAPSTNVPLFPPSLLRKVPNAAERWLELERLGYVPEGADDKDWWLAQRTTWWGKKLDAAVFWKGRVVWADSSATLAARRRGRAFPPIPEGERQFDYRSDADRTIMPSSDSENIPFRYSDRENVFWRTFAKTHPSPPELISKGQIDLAHEILGSRHRFGREGNASRLSKRGLDAMDAAARSEAQTLGYPSEALADEALRWAYILEQRDLYEQQFVRKGIENTLWSSNYLARVWVDAKFITEPLSEEQMKAGNAWKAAYLQRLRRENIDQSYITAYLQAWNLKPVEVFEDERR